MFTYGLGSDFSDFLANSKVYEQLRGFMGADLSILYKCYRATQCFYSPQNPQLLHIQYIGWFYL